MRLEALSSCLVLFLLSACGGRASESLNGSSRSAANEDGTTTEAIEEDELENDPPGAEPVNPPALEPPEETPEPEAFFSPLVVAGLPYRCADGTEGLTDEEGGLLCALDTEVTFFIGDLELGHTAAKEDLNFFALASHEPPTHHELGSYFFSQSLTRLPLPWANHGMNVAQLLYTLDADQDPTNDIALPEELPEDWHSLSPRLSWEDPARTFFWKLEQLISFEGVPRTLMDAGLIAYWMYEKGALTGPIWSRETTRATDPVSGEELPRWSETNTFDDRGRIVSWADGFPVGSHSRRSGSYRYDSDLPRISSIGGIYQEVFDQRGMTTSRPRRDYVLNDFGLVVERFDSYSPRFEEYFYTRDSWGRVSSSSHSLFVDDELKWTQSKEFAYDSWGSPILETSTSTDHAYYSDEIRSFERTTSYAYNSEGRPLSVSHSSPSLSQYVRTYDIEGRIASCVSLHGGQSEYREFYTYELGQMKTLRSERGEPGEVDEGSTTEFFYNDLRQLVRSVTTNIEGVETSESLYTYNEQGLLQTALRPAVNSSQMQFFEYEYREVPPSGFVPRPEAHFWLGLRAGSVIPTEWRARPYPPQ